MGHAGTVEIREAMEAALAELRRTEHRPGGWTIAEIANATGVCRDTARKHVTECGWECLRGVQFDVMGRRQRKLFWRPRGGGHGEEEVGGA